MHRTDFIFCFYLTGFGLFFKGIFSFLSHGVRKKQRISVFPFCGHILVWKRVFLFYTRAVLCDIVRGLRCEDSRVALPGAPGRGPWPELADRRSEGRPAAQALPASCSSSCPARPPAVCPCRRAGRCHPPVTCGAGDTVHGSCGQSPVLTTVSGGSFVFPTWRRLEEAEFSSVAS